MFLISKQLYKKKRSASKMANGNFANKTFANRTFANGESPWVYWRKYSGLSPIGEIPGGALAKLQWTFANWRNSRGCVGESTVDFRELSRNNINIGYMSELKLMLLKYIYHSLHSRCVRI
jgi:hypothetical protein